MSWNTDVERLLSILEKATGDGGVHGEKLLENIYSSFTTFVEQLVAYDKDDIPSEFVKGVGSYL